jgi:hypothetical protein
MRENPFFEGLPIAAVSHSVKDILEPIFCNGETSTNTMWNYCGHNDWEYAEALSLISGR